MITANRRFHFFGERGRISRCPFQVNGELKQLNQLGPQAPRCVRPSAPPPVDNVGLRELHDDCLNVMKPEEMNMIMSMNLMKPFDDGIPDFFDGSR
jgi:hypothetical protein